MIKINSGEEISEEYVQNSDTFIISRTGEKFFQNYISLNCSKTTKIKNGYLMVYDFRIPGKNFVNEEITFLIDSTGNLMTGREIIGIPDCLNSDCDFRIDENKAKQIAAENKLEKGIKEWKIEFLWDDNYKKYVWSVQSTSSKGSGSQGYRGTGKIMFIDALTGSVIESKEWQVN
jgi:hypothetical protein